MINYNSVECINLLVNTVKNNSNYYENESQAKSVISNMLIARGEECIDNKRVGYFDDSNSIVEYNKQVAEGCCGAYDEICIIGDRLAIVGYNFGH